LPRNKVVESKSEISMKTEVDQISLFQGKKFIGRLDYNISKLLMQLKEYYNWNFSVEIEKIKRTTTHNIIFITNPIVILILIF